MTINDRVKKALEDFDGETDNIDKLVALAYYIGREDATKEVSDKYTALLANQRSRAAACRYYKLAYSIIGDTTYIYNPDYRQDMKTTFGTDPTNL